MSAPAMQDSDGSIEMYTLVRSTDDGDSDSDILGDDISPLVVGSESAIQTRRLSLQEDNEGGLGRHLGLYSTTLMM